MTCCSDGSPAQRLGRRYPIIATQAGNDRKQCVKNGQRGGKSGQLRIIAGQWRGRRLTFPEIPGLRPTGDRIRETLFNWLGAELAGARCLDLFAGSGALGMEALSRGAAHCDFVERDHKAAAALNDHLDSLGARQRGRVYSEDAAQFLSGENGPYDIVFLDPPFAIDQLTQTCDALLASTALTDQTLVYVEHSARQSPTLPAVWSQLRAKRSGEVMYTLQRATQS
jgi:16S rRNA (guanine966-N2)-methyltransferase